MNISPYTNKKPNWLLLYVVIGTFLITNSIASAIYRGITGCSKIIKL